MEKTSETLNELEMIIGGQTFGENSSYLIICKAYRYLCDNKLIDFIDENLLKTADEMCNRIPSVKADKIDSIFKELTIDDIRTIVYEILSGNKNDLIFFNDSSSDFICELANDLLEIDEKNDIVVDFCSGIGNFLANVYKNAYNSKKTLKGLIGIEISTLRAHISQMALFILCNGSLKPEVILGNALDKTDLKYTKAYTFPPLGMKNVLFEKTRKSMLFPDYLFSYKNTCDWLFADNTLKGLDDGRAVALVTSRALTNDCDIEYRNKLISSHLVEGIIELPAGSLSFTGLKTYMLIFSKNNKQVKFIDASQLVSKDSKRYTNLELPVKTIEEMYYSSEVKTKTNEELINKSNLCPSNILVDVKSFDNGVKLNEIADVFTGNQYTYGIFEKKKLITDENTGYRILTSSDIENGIVQWENLHSIIMNDKKFDKFSVKYGDVIVTSKSSKVKTVVVDIVPKEKILVTGGMLIVRPKNEKINPTYLKMFFDSKAGQAAFKSIQKGSIIVTITASSLASIEVPMISIEKQNIKAEKYNEKLSTLAAYKKEIERIENSLNNLFEEEED